MQHYFAWGGSSQLAREREPAIEYGQVPLWMAEERRRIATGEHDLAITSEEWQQLNQQALPLGGHVVE